MMTILDNLQKKQAPARATRAGLLRKIEKFKKIKK